MEKTRSVYPIIVAVDGPAASGKSSICQTVSETLSWSYVNTGTIYRAAAKFVTRSGIAPDNLSSFYPELEKFASEGHWDFKEGTIIFGQHVFSKEDLETEETGFVASYVARDPFLRQILLPLQRNIARSAKNGIILDGRDIATVVFPDADIKIYMTASAEARAKRRLEQLQNQNKSLTYDVVLKDIQKRDEQDLKIEIAPLKVADNSVILDTSMITFEEVCQKMIEILKNFKR